jgi:hypothetical protein
MMADVPCFIEREVKVSQLKVGLINAAFSRADSSGLTLESKKSSCVSLDKFLKSIAKPKPN